MSSFLTCCTPDRSVQYLFMLWNEIKCISHMHLLNPISTANNFILGNSGNLRRLDTDEGNGLVLVDILPLTPSGPCVLLDEQSLTTVSTTMMFPGSALKQAIRDQTI